jgi:TolB protein
MSIRSSPPSNPSGKTVLPCLLVVVLALACGPDSTPTAIGPLGPSLDAVGNAQLSRAAGGGQEGKIVFHSNRGGGSLDVYVMNADGTDQTAITSDDNEDIDPTWSPNGKLIAFNRFPADFSGCEVYVMNADGSGVRQLTHDAGYDFGGIWSPDGKQIAFKSTRDGDDDLYVINVDGTGIRQVTNLGWVAGPTAWSPNGKQIAFIGYYDYIVDGAAGDREIYVVNVGNGKITQLTDNHVEDEGDHAGWSPDGKLFSFSSRRDGGDLDIFVMNANGTGVRQITGIGGDGAVDDDDSFWSPDGKYLAFQSTRDGDEEVYTIPVDLSRPARQLTFNNVFSDAVPVWARGRVHSSGNNDDHHE